MTYNASKEQFERGLSAEDRIYRKIAEALSGTGLSVRRGPVDPRENGEYGDIHIAATADEFPFVMIEVKSSTYPSSFSLSDYEKRVSKATYVVVDGPMGIWVVAMGLAKGYCEKKDDYWISRPPLDCWTKFSDMISHIRSRYSIH